ncbi:hypothetical protein NEIFLAOT_02103 [Neisseria flavescens NRL30031/H210]|uniref:Uncharacterized protein n=1 Tax=Neisseria flavescens NRL30031/H210 TaxID=546264 RepID=C0EQ61_NEIFL|nr:hypothetical protein NEIFLAOT_02103 [Neisseria flavescens NRL30031/H210]
MTAVGWIRVMLSPCCLIQVLAARCRLNFQTAWPILTPRVWRT